MTDPGGRIDAERTARFHFDPLRDSSRTPTREAFEAWIVARGDVPGSPLHRSLGTVAKAAPRRAGPIASLLAAFLPPLRALLVRRDRRRSLEALRSRLDGLHSLLREFAIDPSIRYDLHVTMDVVASMWAFVPHEEDSRRIARETRPHHPDLADELDRIADETDVEMRSAAALAGLRVTLENEAVLAIVTGDVLEAGDARRRAVLACVLEEVRGEDTRRLVADVVRRIG